MSVGRRRRRRIAPVSRHREQQIGLFFEVRERVVGEQLEFPQQEVHRIPDQHMNNTIERTEAFREASARAQPGCCPCYDATRTRSAGRWAKCTSSSSSRAASSGVLEEAPQAAPHIASQIADLVSS
jgi:hypothetical protein